LPSIKGTKTEQNLLKAFAGESQARSRYTLYAEKAREEGYQHIANIFMETAENELYHAEQFMSFLEGGEVEITASYPVDIKTTIENLEYAAHGENYEHTTMYPEFAEIAQEEGFPKIAHKFKMIAKVEVEHEQRYLTLLQTIKDETVFKKDEPVRWKCIACGYVHTGVEPPKICPVCGKPHDYYELAQEY
jgi:rubrerythrin